MPAINAWHDHSTNDTTARVRHLICTSCLGAGLVERAYLITTGIGSPSLTRGSEEPSAGRIAV